MWTLILQQFNYKIFTITNGISSNSLTKQVLGSSKTWILWFVLKKIPHQSITKKIKIVIDENRLIFVIWDTQKLKIRVLIEECEVYFDINLVYDWVWMFL